MATTPGSADAPAKKSHWLINRNFAFLWVGDTISILGDFSFSITLTLWVSLTLAKGQSWAPLANSGLILAATIPMMVIGPIAGVYVDRWDKRRTMMVVNLLQALLVGVLVLTTFAPGGHLPLEWQLGLIYAVSFLLISNAQFYNQAGNTLVMDIVPPEDQPRAIGRVLTMVSIGTIVGPSIGAPLFAIFGPRWALLINAISFLVSFSTLLAVRPPQVAESSSKPDEKKRFFPEFASGLRFLFGSPILRAMLIATVIYTVGTSALNALNVFYLTGNLQIPEEFYGFAGSALGIGALVGSMIGSGLVKRLGLERVFWGSLVTLGVLILIYTRLPFYTLALGLLLILGIPTTTTTIAAGPLYFRVTPRNVLARTTSVRVSVVSIAGLIGATLAGSLGSTMSSLRVDVLGVVFTTYDTIIMAGGVFVLLGGLYAMAKVRNVPPPPQPAAAQPAQEEPAAAVVQIADPQPSQESAS